MKDILSILKERGLFKQCSNENGLKATLAEGPQKCYLGIDPTGPSLHIGHLVPLYACAHLQQAGHIPIILIGGGTARIGDPSGKTETRQMLSYEQIAANVQSQKPQIAKLIDLSPPKALLLDNAEWLTPLHYIDFLRDIGKHFSVNRMLSFEAYKQRLEKGLSFIEFNYQLLQSYDFLQLYRQEGCRLQLGGDDQWGNIVAGIDLIRRVEASETYGLTVPLITRSDGKKMGKTEAGSLFLEPSLTSVYDFYQYWRNIPDSDLERFLLLFTFLPSEECHELGKAEGQAINTAKEKLAFEVSRLLHGEKEALKAKEATQAAFSGSGDKSGIPTQTIPRQQYPSGINVVELFTLTNLCSSKSEARRLITQGGASLDGKKVENPESIVELEGIKNNEILLKAGKKRFFRLEII